MSREKKFKRQQNILTVAKKKKKNDVPICQLLQCAQAEWTSGDKHVMGISGGYDQFSGFTLHKAGTLNCNRKCFQA